MSQESKLRTAIDAVKKETQYRTVQLRNADEESRTAELSFSSEAPVERFFGDEILDHSSSSIRLDRLRAGGPLLMDHDHRNQIGVVEDVAISTDDRKGRARVRFSRSERAQEIFQDVMDGIRGNVSVGYRVHKMVLEESSDERDIFRVTDWEPLEVSLVSVPADTSVGVGRSNEEINEVIKMSEETRNEEVAPAPTVDVRQIEADARQQARKAENARVRAIRELGSRFNMNDEAESFANSDRSFADFKDAVLEKVNERSKKEKVTPDQKMVDLDLSEREVKTYSFMRAIRAKATGNWKGAEFELECSRALEEQIGREPEGIFIPYAAFRKHDDERVMTAGTATSGAELKGTDHLANLFIDRLRPNSITMSLGATMLTGLDGDVDIPKLAGGVTFTWVAEDGTETLSDATTASVTLAPKTVSGATAISRRLLKQSSPSVESVIMNDLIRGAAETIDVAALDGGGANEPVGIISTSGVGTSSIATPGSPTHAELVEFETDVASAKALRGSLAYAATPAVIGNLKTTAKDAGSGRFLLENGMANGYPVASTTNLPANGIIFGNWNDVMIGMWGVLDVLPDPYTRADRGGLILHVYQDLDVALRHAESFSINSV